MFHLFFVEDLILFDKASLDQVNVIKRALKIFYGKLGQRVNYAKSCIYFSKNVHFSRREELCAALRIQLAANLGCYFWVPLLHDKWSIGNYQVNVINGNHGIFLLKFRSKSNYANFYIYFLKSFHFQEDESLVQPLGSSLQQIWVVVLGCHYFMIDGPSKTINIC